MHLKKLMVLFSLVLGSGLIAASIAAESESPHEIIESAASAISERLDGRQDYLADNPDELFSLVNEILVPYFDSRYAGRLALGNHWKRATPDQRDRFVQVFYDFLLQSYATGVLKFNQDAITVHNSIPEEGAKRTVVKTDMRMDDGSVVPVNYSLRKSKKGWRVYDVRIEGVSYIQNYRNQFNAEIAALGVDAVIERLQNETEKASGAEST